MAQLAEHVIALTELIEAGRTVEAIERCYADDVSVQENERPPRIGKAVCLEHERRMLAGVTGMQATLLSQAIHNETGVVFSEWCYVFTDVSGRGFSLTEVSVQHWQNERIYREKFYYNNILTTP